MSGCWLAFEDGERGYEVVHYCDLEYGHDGPHVARLETASESGLLTWQVKSHTTISRGREGEQIRGQVHDGAAIAAALRRYEKQTGRRLLVGD